MDGEIDYGKYSLRELREAESHISSDRFPKNHQNLKREIERRYGDGGQIEPETAQESEERVWERPENSGELSDMASSKSAKYIAVFVAVGVTLNVITESTLEANGYSFGHLTRIFTYSIAAMLVGWMFCMFQNT